MKLKNLEQQIANLLIFSKNNLRNFEKRDNVLDANIKYWIKKKKLTVLKKGLYLFKNKYDQEIQKDLYLEYLANQLIQPSYISLEYVLAKYQLLSEPVNAITSITTKTTREFSNTLNTFRFYSISPKLFFGYQIKYFNNSPIFIADKSKALFDYLYLRFLKNEPINKQAVQNLRLNWENITKKELIKTCSYQRYTKNKRIKQVLEIINKLYA